MLFEKYFFAIADVDAICRVRDFSAHEVEEVSFVFSCFWFQCCDGSLVCREIHFLQIEAGIVQLWGETYETYVGGVELFTRFFLQLAQRNGNFLFSSQIQLTVIAKETSGIINTKADVLGWCSLELHHQALVGCQVDADLERPT